MKDNDIIKDQQEYISEVSKKPMSKVLSWISLAVIAILVIATLVTGVMGSQYFWGCLVLMILVPIFMYCVLWFGKLMFVSSRDKNTALLEDEETKDNNK